MTRRAARSAPAFTLVELILVMALLATVMAFAAPSLSRSLRERNLAQEAVRLIAATEYGRDEAVSQGVPMIVSIEPETRRIAVEPKPGYAVAGGRSHQYWLSDEVRIEATARATSGGVLEAVEFSPGGTPEPASVAQITLTDRFENQVVVARTPDGWGYEILKEAE